MTTLQKNKEVKMIKSVSYSSLVTSPGRSPRTPASKLTGTNQRRKFGFPDNEGVFLNRFVVLNLSDVTAAYSGFHMIMSGIKRAAGSE